MKILLINDFLYPQTHGIAVRFEHYIKYIKEQNHSITVYGPSNCPTTDKHLPSIINCFNKDNRICFPSLQLIWDICFNKYDIIHLVYPPCIPSLIIFAISLFKPLKIVTSNHVNMHYYGKTYNLLYSYYLVKFFICDLQYYFSKLIMAPSISEDFKKLYNLETTIIPTGIDLNNFKFSNLKRENVLLYIGRLAPEKNIDKLIKLFDTIKNYNLVIIGYGPEEERLKYLAKDNNNIIFIGKKNHTELPYYYQLAKAHITLSESETFGLTLLESLSCGTPIIYPNCEVFTTLYEKDFGELCLSTNNTLQNIINYIELNEEELQIRCKEYSEKHSWSQATDKLIKIYNDIIN